MTISSNPKSKIPMTRIALYITITLILVSPFLFYATGIGQKAHLLSQEPVSLADGNIKSSPKAEALHSLRLPIRVEQTLLYPALLFLIQFSGLAVKLRQWLEDWLAPRYQSRLFIKLNKGGLRLFRGRFSLPDGLLILLYLSSISLFLSLLYLPFSVYTGFILRHQFGISTQSFSAWFRDFWLNFAISLIITLLLFGGFYVLQKLMPKRWPFWAGLGLLIFSFGYTILQPLIVTPLFYQVTPVTDSNLRARIELMTERAGVIIDDISIIDASSKTTLINAYFTGYGGASKIVLWDNLLSKHPPDEVDVVIAHEMGHWVHRHVLISLLGSTALAWIGFYLLRWWLNRVWAGLGLKGPDDVAGYPYLLGLIALVSVLSLPVVNGVSRFAEAQADDFAIAVSQQPEATATLFKRFARQNLSMVNVPAWEKLIFYTHPPLGERIQKAVEASNKMERTE